MFRPQPNSGRPRSMKSRSGWRPRTSGTSQMRSRPLPTPIPASRRTSNDRRLGGFCYGFVAACPDRPTWWTRTFCSASCSRTAPNMEPSGNVRIIFGRAERSFSTHRKKLAEFWNVCTRLADRNGFGFTVAESDERAALIEAKFSFAADRKHTSGVAQNRCCSERLRDPGP